MFPVVGTGPRTILGLRAPIWSSIQPQIGNFNVPSLDRDTLLIIQGLGEALLGLPVRLSSLGLNLGQYLVVELFPA